MPQFLIRIIVLILLLPGLIQAQVVESGGEQGQESLIQSRIEALSALKLEIQTKRDEQKALEAQVTGKEVNAELTEAVADLSSEIKELEQEFLNLALGSQAQDINKGDDVEFDVQKEVVKLAEPLIYAVQQATDRSRTIQELRRDIDRAKAKQGIAEQALKSVSETNAAYQARASDELKSELQGMEEEWRKKVERFQQLELGLSDQLNQLNEQIAAEQEFDITVVTDFMLTRGTTIGLVILAASGVWFLIVLIRGGVVSFYRRRNDGPLTFGLRVFVVIMTVSGAAAAFVAALVVLNLREDVVLLTLMLLIAIALAWVALKSLPQYASILNLLLNNGSVKEGQRLVYEGIPFKVDQLSFQTVLDNPWLAGDKLTIPVASLLEMQSRPMDQGESWFPTRQGDWVVLDDETLAQVRSQSFEAVELELDGGSKRRLLSTNFIDMGPINLSVGFEVSYDFRLKLGPAVQTLPETLAAMKLAVEQDLLHKMDADLILELDIVLVDMIDQQQVLRLDANFTGPAAQHYSDIKDWVAMAIWHYALSQGWKAGSEPYQPR